MLGCLEKHPSKGFLTDSRNPIIEGDCAPIEVDFRNQCVDTKEEIDNIFPILLMSQMESNAIIDSYHGCNLMTGKSVTSLLGFIGLTPIGWFAKRQASVQTATFKAEIIALKRGIEEAIARRCYLRSFKAKVLRPTTVHNDNMLVLKNSTNPLSSLERKRIALVHHFCRE